jgi:ketosteroid isomerase-like protein
LQSAARGQAAVTEQRYAICSSVARGDTVGLEVDWSARLKIALGKLAVGDELRARLAMFITLKDGRIVSQRNYDCFEPF